MFKIISHLKNILSDFKDVNSIPPSILEKVIPFALDNENMAKYTSGYHLQTKNEELIELLESVKIEDGGVIVDGLNDFVTPENLIVLQEVFTKLNNSSVLCIQRMNDNHQENHNRIVVQQNIKCECGRCIYNDLKLSELIIHLRDIFIDHLTNDFVPKKILEESYAFFSIGEFEKSYHILKNAETLIDKEEHPMLFFILKYNQKRLGPFIKYMFTPEEIAIENKKKILKYIDSIDLIDLVRELELVGLKRELALSIRDKELIIQTQREILSSRDKLKNNYKRYLREGFWSSGDRSLSQLQENFALIFQFLNHNILFDLRYYYYSELCLETFEGLLASYMTSERYAHRYKAFNIFFIKEFVLRLSPGDIKRLLSQYKVETIVLDSKDSSLEKVVDLAINFFQSFFQINNFLGRKASLNTQVANQIKGNHIFENHCENLVSNQLLFLAHIDIGNTSDNKVIKLIEVIIDFMSVEENLRLVDEDIIALFLEKKLFLLSDTQVQEMIAFSISDKWWSDRVLGGLAVGIKEFHNTFILNDTEIVGRIIQRASYRRKYLVRPIGILPVYKFLDEKGKKLFYEYFMDIIEEQITKESIDWNLYFRLVDNEVINYGELGLHKLFIEKRMATFEKGDIKILDGDYYLEDHYLYRFIDLYYKHKIHVSVIQPILDNIHVPPFIKWVLRPKSSDYNYDEFDPTWILVFNCKSGAILSRIGAMRIKQVKDTVRQYLIEDHNAQLSEIYFRYLI